MKLTLRVILDDPRDILVTIKIKISVNYNCAELEIKDYSRSSVSANERTFSSLLIEAIHQG